MLGVKFKNVYCDIASFLWLSIDVNLFWVILDNPFSLGQSTFYCKVVPFEFGLLTDQSKGKEGQKLWHGESFWILQIVIGHIDHLVVDFFVKEKLLECTSIIKLLIYLNLVNSFDDRV